MSIKDKFDREKFNQIYKGTASFCETKYFQKFMEMLSDERLLENIKFANDVLGVPPVESMIKYYRTFFNELMLPSEKQGLGACFGYLYRFIYQNYQAEQVWVGDTKITGIKTASFFRLNIK